MENTKTIGPVTFSNYISHKEVKPLDANGKYIDVIWVTVSDNGYMRADYDTTEFMYHYSAGWNSEKEIDAGRTDNIFGSGNWKLSQKGITPYPPLKQMALGAKD